jgi:hypothetical protein
MLWGQFLIFNSQQSWKTTMSLSETSPALLFKTRSSLNAWQNFLVFWWRLTWDRWGRIGGENYFKTLLSLVAYLPSWHYWPSVFLTEVPRIKKQWITINMLTLQWGEGSHQWSSDPDDFLLQSEAKCYEEKKSDLRHHRKI